MRIDQLYRRTAIRLALAFSMLFAVMVFLLFALVYFSLTQSLETRIRGRVLQTRDALVRVDREQGFDDLKSVVESEAASVRDADGVYMLVGENNEYLAGNVQHAAKFRGWRILDRAQFPAIQNVGKPDDRFYAIWTPVSRGELLVGANNRVITYTESTLLDALLWGLVLATTIPAVVGTHLAWQAQRKIDALSSTLSAVAAGQISQRAPVSDARDDLDHVADQVNLTLDYLQRLILNVNQTSSDIAHDLKHPIGRLRQRLDTARANAQSVAEFRCVIGDALKEIDMIVDTFEALLRITQIEAGAGRKRFVPLDLKTLLSDVADVYGPVIEDEGHKFECAIDATGDAKVRGDSELLTQLFANIIENSIHHCPKGTAISIALSADPDHVVARLADTGPGIPEEERNKVFQRLYRLEKSRSTPGSGLGLSLAAAIAELHKAKIKLADNQPGLCVTIAFPHLAA
ncbi:MAG: HAMP domain-containing sensor histidine kinase [Rhodomicrobiaceae bacterium]